MPQTDTPPVAEPAYWRYMVNATWENFSKVKPPDDAYDEGTLTPLYAHPPAAEPVAEMEGLERLDFPKSGPGINRDLYPQTMVPHVGGRYVRYDQAAARIAAAERESDERFNRAVAEVSKWAEKYGRLEVQLDSANATLQSERAARMAAERILKYQHAQYAKSCAAVGLHGAVTYEEWEKQLAALAQPPRREV